MIDCLNVAESTAWDCRVIDSRGTLELCPPVTFADGAIIPIYVIPVGETSVEITDDGGFKEHLARCGLRVALDSRRLATLERIIANWGVGFSDALSIVSTGDSLAFAFQRYLGALFDVARWELEILNLPPDNTALVQELELYLLALSPAGYVERDIPLRGISGRYRKFPVKLNGVLYDAVGTHPASSASMVKKLYDVTAAPSNMDAKITVVVDDRKDAEQASSDIQIYSGLAHVDKMSGLQKRAMGAMSVTH